jgi:thiopeptide-type bacteriocin biosynthesis protein
MGHIHPTHHDVATWHQVFIGFPDYTAAQDIAATHLAPILDTAEGDGLVTSWFFTRKNPFWRLRFTTGPNDRDGAEFLRLRLQALTEAGHLASAAETIYEPEVHAFGGPHGMTVAHHLFHADSRHVLAHHRAEQDAAIGRRELSVLLCSALLRGSGQDWYEQGDVWARVAAHQTPLPADVPPDRLHHLQTQLRQLMTTDTSPGSPLLTDAGPPAVLPAWVAAFADAGRALRNLADTGTLQRGLRAVLAHHVLFHWNRVGLDPNTKALLAHAATGTVFADRTSQVIHPRDDGAQPSSQEPTDARQP